MRYSTFKRTGNCTIGQVYDNYEWAGGNRLIFIELNFTSKKDMGPKGFFEMACRIRESWPVMRLPAGAPDSMGWLGPTRRNRSAWRFAFR